MSIDKKIIRFELIGRSREKVRKNSFRYKYKNNEQYSWFYSLGFLRRGVGFIKPYYQESNVTFKGQFKLTANRFFDEPIPIPAFIKKSPCDLNEYWLNRKPEYSIDQIIYLMELTPDISEKLEEQMFDIDIYHGFMASIYIDHSKINEDDYQYSTELNKKILKVAVKINNIELRKYIDYNSKEIVINPIKNDNFGIPYVELFESWWLSSVDEFMLNCLSTPESADISYSIDTAQYQLGKKTVEKVIQALQQIKGVEAWETGANSIADVYYKWDLVIKLEDKCYPIQVKSNLHDAEKASDFYSELRVEEKIPFVPLVFWANFNSSANEIAEYIKGLLDISEPISKFNNIKVEKHISNKVNHQNRTSYNKRKKAYKKFKGQILRSAKQGVWDKQAEESLQKLVDTSKHKHKLIEFCRFIAEARNIQAELIEQKQEKESEDLFKIKHL